MKIAVVFEPDAALGPDPLDAAQMLRRLGEFIDGDKVDALLVWREYGADFEGGSRTHLVASGAWEHLRDSQGDAIVERLGALE